ncbi:MAG: Uma2 family endonuclease [Aphanocapsa sp. GSE-SYN-MK-11-07L]|jgi:Uma2 family endonuclease|nr:Uma2 family endonuclease [Aphanocapsa sp. GSE-SYN-MK-11-07L]
MVTTGKKITFEQYLTDGDRPDQRYELVRGDLVLMTPPIFQHIFITKFLERIFDAEIARLGLPWIALKAAGQRTEIDSSRLPDLCIVPMEAAEVLRYSPAIFKLPALVVAEIVSPGSIKDDCEDKLKEYQAIAVVEYWIIDPTRKDPRVTVCTLKNETYEQQVFRGSVPIISATFPELEVSVDQIMAAKL